MKKDPQRDFWSYPMCTLHRQSIEVILKLDSCDNYKSRLCWYVSTYSKCDTILNACWHLEIKHSSDTWRRYVNGKN